MYWRTRGMRLFSALREDLRVLPVLTLLSYAEIVLCLAALCFLVIKRQWKDYWALGSFLAVRVVSDTTLAVLHQLVHQLGRSTAYQAYFWVYWMAFAVESVLALFLVYGVFRLTLQPLKGLLKVGTIFFCGVAVASEVYALRAAFGPHLSGMSSLIAMISQLQRNQSLLTLGMLLFVFFAMRPAGVSGRSRIFGVGLGLGALAINDLVQSAWLTFRPNVPMVFAINGAVFCAALVLWTAYFALPEPERGEIDFRSPLWRWNRICLGWFA